MKRTSFSAQASAMLVVVSALASQALALGEVVGSFAAPAADPRALAWGDGYLHCYTASAPYLIWKINPSTGQPAGSFSFPPTGAATSGLGYDANYDYYWAANRDTDNVYRFYTNGSIISSFHASWDVGQGLTWTGMHIWATTAKITYDYLFVEAKIDGSIIHSFHFYYYPYQPGSDGEYLWIGNKDESTGRYFVTALKPESGGQVEFFAPPAVEPAGLTYGGGYLWLATTAGNGWIWKIKVGDVGVAPQSLGRIKALFR